MKDPSLIVSIAAIVVSVVGVIFSYVLARKYGDVAALNASRKLHEEDARRARLIALRSLLHEVERIRGVVAYNRGLTSSQPQGIARMPVVAFETAFVSGTRGLDVGDELLQAVVNYLVWADAINSLVDLYPFSVAGRGTGGASNPREVARQIVVLVSAQELSQTLDQLETRLQEESQRV